MYSAKLVLPLPAICLPHQDGRIPISAFPNSLSKLAGLFLTLSLLPIMLSVKRGSCDFVNTSTTSLLRSLVLPDSQSNPSLQLQRWALLRLRLPLGHLSYQIIGTLIHSFDQQQHPGGIDYRCTGTFFSFRTKQLAPTYCTWVTCNTGMYGNLVKRGRPRTRTFSNWQPWTFCWQPWTFLPGGRFKREHSFFCQVDLLNANVHERGLLVTGNRGLFAGNRGLFAGNRELFCQVDLLNANVRLLATVDFFARWTF